MFEKIYPLDWKPRYQEYGDDYLQYAEMYKNVVEILLDNACSRKGYDFKSLDNRLNTSHGHDYEILPILFNFRHYLELQLTGLILYGSIISPNLKEDLDAFMIGARESHSLMKLYNKLKTVEIPKKYWTKEITKLIQDFDKLDPRSDRFRYPENRMGIKFYEGDDKKYKKEYNKEFLKKITILTSSIYYMITAIDHFENLEAYFDMRLDNYYENQDYKNNF